MTPSSGGSSPFSGCPVHVRIAPEIVYRGERGGRTHRVVSWLLRVSYLAESVRSRALLRGRAVVSEGGSPRPVPSGVGAPAPRGGARRAEGVVRGTRSTTWSHALRRPVLRHLDGIVLILLTPSW